MRARLNAHELRSAEYQSGIKFTDRGLKGFVVEPTGHFQEAVTRHNSLLESLDEPNELSPGARVLLMLPANECILNMNRLKSSVRKGASQYLSEDARFIEFQIDGGWRDRRQISNQTAIAMELNGGSLVSSAHWAEAS